MEAMELINEVLSLGVKSNPAIDNDSHERITLCLTLLQNALSPMAQVSDLNTHTWLTRRWWLHCPPPPHRYAGFQAKIGGADETSQGIIIL